MADWCINLETVGSERAQLLMSPVPFPAILDRIRRGNPPRPRFEAGHPGGLCEGAQRAVWTLTPGDREAVDLFFNGVDGYRVAYAVSATLGDERNDAAIRALANWLLEGSGPRASCESASLLLGKGAKIWIVEDRRINEALITGKFTQPEVIVERWVRAASSRVKVATDRGDRYKAAAGVLCPSPTRLHVIGPWVHDGQVVERQVKHRGGEIYAFGYT